MNKSELRKIINSYENLLTYKLLISLNVDYYLYLGRTEIDLMKFNNKLLCYKSLNSFKYEDIYKGLNNWNMN